MAIYKLKTTFSRIERILDSCRTLDTSGGQNLLKTGAKARYLGGGWWVIIGTDTAVRKARMAEKLEKLHTILRRVQKRNHSGN